MAQPGSASGLGPEGREFKSLCPDQFYVLRKMFSYRRLPSFFSRVFLLEIALLFFLTISYCYKFNTSTELQIQNCFSNTAYDIEKGILKFIKKYKNKYPDSNSKELSSMVKHIDDITYSVDNMLDEDHVLPLQKVIEQYSNSVRKKKVNYALFDQGRKAIVESFDSEILCNHGKLINNYMFNLEHASSNIKVSDISFLSLLGLTSSTQIIKLPNLPYYLCLSRGNFVDSKIFYQAFKETIIDFIILLISAFIVFSIHMSTLKPIKSVLYLTKNIINGATKKIENESYLALYQEFYLISKALSQNVQYSGNIMKLKEEISMLEQQLNYEEEVRKSLTQNISSEIIKKLKEIESALNSYISSGKPLSLKETQGIKYDLLSVLEGLQNYVTSSELDSADIFLAKENIELSNLINKIETSLKGQLTIKNISVRSIVSPYVPRIYLDVEKTKLAFLYLLSHICEHSHSDSELDIVCYKSMNSIIIELKNDTYNITRKQMDKIKEYLYTSTKSYYQKESGIEKELAIAINILNLHNARIDIRSNETIGVMIRVSFDIKQKR